MNLRAPPPSCAHIHANSGIDQGCPHSPCDFAAAVDSVSRFILSEATRLLDNGAKLPEKLDDGYLCINPQYIPEAIDIISSATRAINLVLKPTKI